MIIAIVYTTNDKYNEFHIYNNNNKIIELFSRYQGGECKLTLIPIVQLVTIKYMQYVIQHLSLHCNCPIGINRH